MKLLKKQKGLPFLLTLGVLFILSASFLAVQLWSEKSLRGALFALETPVMPPAIPRVIAPPAEKKTAKKSAIVVETAVVPVGAPMSDKDSLEVSEVKQEPDSTPILTEAASINKAEVKSDEPVATVAKVQAPAKPVVKAKIVAAPAVESLPKKETRVVVGVKEPVKAVSVAKEPRKTRKKAKIEEIPTEIPAEWNWFAKPLKLDMNKGKAVIELDKTGLEIKLSATEKIKSEIPVETAIEASVEAIVEAPVPSIPATEVVVTDSIAAVPVAEPVTDKPFMIALARMSRIRQLRNAATYSPAMAEKKELHISPSMSRLVEVIQGLCAKLDRQSAAHLSDSPELETSPVQVLEKASDESAATDAVTTEEGSDKTALKPYYGGSNSSFSQRINSLLKSGLVSAE